MNKKGEAKPGSNAAILILIIGIAIVIYAVLYDKAVQQETLLNESLNATLQRKFLLKEHVGLITSTEKDRETYSLPSVTLYTMRKSNIFQSIPYGEASTNLFGAKVIDLNFTVDDLNIAQNMVLAMTSDQTSNRNLIVQLNGIDIYHDKLTSNVKITLNKYNLKQGVNNIKISAESSFFTTRFILRNIQVIGDIYDMAKNKAFVDFTVFDEDLKDFKSATMSYYVDCMETEAGRLSIYVNNDKIYEALPDCNVRNRHITVPLNDITSGTNRVRFENEYGSYVLDDIQVEAMYIKPKQPIYYFTADKEDISNVNRKVNLEFRFPDRELKDAMMWVNNKPLVLRTYDMNASYDITSSVVEGFNSVKIMPSESLEITEMAVQVVNR